MTKDTDAQKEENESVREETFDQEDEEDDGDDEQEGAGTRRNRNRRKTSESSYRPIDFKHMAANGPVIVPGRGKKLGDIPKVKANIDKYALDSEEMKRAHRFLFKLRGPFPKKTGKQSILQFSGYLRGETNKHVSKEQMEKDDSEMETEFSSRAYRLHIREIKQLCDFFNVDRKPGKNEIMDKDLLVDRLLDFLSAPNEETMNSKEEESTTETPTPPSSESLVSKKRKRSVVEESEDEKDEPGGIKDWVEFSREEGMFALVRDHDKGDEPSDVAVRQWVQAFVACYDMDTATMKMVLQVASAKFGVDMKSKKNLIKEFLVEEI